MKFDTLIKAVFAVAALLAAGTYAWNTFVDKAETAHADGVDTKDGYDVTTFGANRQGGYIAVTKFSENPFEAGQMRHTITFYEIVKSGGDGDAKLYLVGSRCIDFDSGPDLIKFDEIKGETPKDLKEAFEKASKGSKRR
ncbi:MAG: hypothetical protein KDB68_07420 [Planctomycetes bacterium]|nr:hypothetical protein [Planctomycetota bacterium]MCA8936019.1 hypothetical protein [Planctomycetota bacterium]MCA8945938.1 hypothetical protein [Planctomycetota bacterium]